MATERTTEARAQDPDRRLRAEMYNALNAAAADAWRECVEECAQDYASHPPLYDGDGDMPDFLDYGWYYCIGGVDDFAYDYILPVAQKAAKRLYCKHRLRQRPNAAKWRKWLKEQAEALTWRYARGADHDVAERMAELFGAQYGLDFSYYLSDGRAVFVITDGDDLGNQWEVLADEHVRGLYRGDFDYLRVVYAYNATKMLLLCIHHEYVGIPSGGWALEWVLKDEWWETTLEEAKEIASEVLRDKDVDKIEE